MAADPFLRIMIAAALLWTLLIFYVAYLDSKVRKLERKLS